MPEKEPKFCKITRPHPWSRSADTSLELLVIPHVVGVDDDLRQLAGLAAGGSAKGRPIGEGDRLRRLPRGALHGKLLSLTSATDKHSCDNETKAPRDDAFHESLLSSHSGALQQWANHASAHFGPTRHWNMHRRTSVCLLSVFMRLVHATQEIDRNTWVCLACELTEVQHKNTDSLRTDDTHLQSAIREPRIATAVSPLADVVEAIDEVHFRELAGSL
jgi:hypothetical protein